MSNKTNRSNPGCAIVALALAILGFCLLKRAGCLVGCLESQLLHAGSSLHCGM